MYTAKTQDCISYLIAVMIKIKYCGSPRGAAAETLQVPGWWQWAAGHKTMESTQAASPRQGAPE